MKFPKISIITPSYNQGQYLEQTIDSVLSQRYPQLEYIIIDGGSSDNSVEIIKKYEKFIAYWISEKDSGQSHAINKGLEKATGEIFNWLNSDDFYEPDALKIVSEGFNESKINVLAGKGNLIRNQKIIGTIKGTDIYKDNLAKTIGWSRIDQPATFFRKSILNRIGTLNIDLQYVMDKDLWIRYLLRFGLDGICQVNNSLVNFRLHDGSKTVANQSRFAHETDRLYCALAEGGGLNNELNAIRSAELVESELNNLLSFERCSQNLLAASIHYFLLYKADAYYFNNQRTKSRLCLKIIDKSYLKREDLILYYSLMLKNYLLPQTFIDTFRRNRYDTCLSHCSYL